MRTTKFKTYLKGAFVVLLSLLCCFSSPGCARKVDENPFFGYADRVYYAYYRATPFRSEDDDGYTYYTMSFSGDTDKVNADAASPDSDISPFAYTVPFYSVDGRLYCMGADEYKNGEVVNTADHGLNEEETRLYMNDDAISVIGVAERLEDGEPIERYGVFRSLYNTVGFSAVEVVDDKPQHYEVTCNLFACTPGDYRVTYYFRELIDYDIDEDGRYVNFTTGDELYSVSAEQAFTMPEATGKKFDIVNVIFSTGSGCLKLILRSMDGTLPYFADDITVEKLGESGWEIDDGGKTRYGSSVFADYFSDFPYPGPGTPATAVYPIKYGTGELPLAHEYRLTLTFTENEDGSGEQYTLVLRLSNDKP